MMLANSERFELYTILSVNILKKNNNMLQLSLRIERAFKVWFLEHTVKGQTTFVPLNKRLFDK